MDVAAEAWVDPSTKRKLESGMFVAQVVGHSMEPRIPDGAYCLFKSPVIGSRTGRIVLARNRSSDAWVPLSVVVRSDAEPDSARAAVEAAGIPYKILDEKVETTGGTSPSASCISLKAWSSAQWS